MNQKAKGDKQPGGSGASASGKIAVAAGAGGVAVGRDVQGDITIYNQLPSRSPKPKPTAPSPSSHFVDREEELERIRRDLIGNSQAVVALQGMGGVGKTALVQKLAAEMANEFPGGIFWGDLKESNSNPLLILETWAQLCGQDVSTLLDPQARADMVRGILASQTEVGRLLLVLDDVRAEWLDAVNHIVSARPKNVPLLFTTRDARLASELAEVSYPLRELPTEQAVNLLKTRAMQVVKQEPVAAARLTELAGGLPLALELAGSLIVRRARKPGWKLQHLCHQIEEGTFEKVLPPTDYLYRPGLAATFSLSYETLSNDQKRLFQAVGALSMTAYTVEHIATVLDWDSKKAVDRLDQLVDLSLMRWDEHGRYVLHPLLQEFAGQLTPASEKKEFCMQLVRNAIKPLINSGHSYERAITAGECVLALGWYDLDAEIRIPVLNALRELMCNEDIPVGRQDAAFLLARMGWLTCIDVKDVSPDEMLAYLGYLGPYLGLPRQYQNLEKMISDILDSPTALSDRARVQLLIYRAAMRGQLGEAKKEDQLLDAAAEDYENAGKMVHKLIKEDGRPEDYRMDAWVLLGIGKIAQVQAGMPGSEEERSKQALLNEAVALYLRAAKSAEDYGQDILVTIRGELCNAYTLLKRWSDAKQAYEQALKALEKCREKPDPLYSSDYAWIIETACDMYLKQGESLQDDEQALMVYTEAHKLAEEEIKVLAEVLRGDDVGLVYANINAGDCLWAMSKRQDPADNQTQGSKAGAQEHWRMALDMATRVGYPRNLVIADSLFMGDFFQEEGI